MCLLYRFGVESRAPTTRSRGKKTFFILFFLHFSVFACSPMVTWTSSPALSLQLTEVELYSGRRRRRRDATLPWEVQSAIFHLNSTGILIKWLIFSNRFYIIHLFKTVNCSTLTSLRCSRMFQVTSFCQSCSSICFRDGLDSSSALWMSWSNNGVHRLHGSVCALWTLAVRYRATQCVSAGFAVARCPSVGLSVTIVYCIQTAKDIAKLLSPPSSQPHHCNCLTPSTGI